MCIEKRIKKTERARSIKCINISDSPTLSKPQIKPKMAGTDTTKPSKIVIGAKIVNVLKFFLLPSFAISRQKEKSVIVSADKYMISIKFLET